MIIKLYIQPGAKKTEFVGEFNNMPKIRVSAPPVEGAANKELINFLSKKFKLRKSQVKIKSGENSRIKLIELPIEDNDFINFLRGRDYDKSK